MVNARLTTAVPATAILPAVVQVKAPVGIKVIVPPPVVNGAIAVIVTTAAVPEIKVMLFVGAIVAALAIVVAAALVPVISETANVPLIASDCVAAVALNVPYINDLVLSPVLSVRSWLLT